MTNTEKYNMFDKVIAKQYVAIYNYYFSQTTHYKSIIIDGGPLTDETKCVYRIIKDACGVANIPVKINANKHDFNAVKKAKIFGRLQRTTAPVNWPVNEVVKQIENEFKYYNADFTAKDIYEAYYKKGAVLE